MKRKRVNGLYLDYAKLMLIKTKLVYNKIDDAKAIQLFKEYADNAIYFQSIARIALAVLLMDKTRNNEEMHSALNFIITDINASETLVSLAKIIQKRIGNSSNSID